MKVRGYVLGQPFVNSVNFDFCSLKGFVHDLQHAKHNLMVFGVLFLELLEDCDDDATNRRDDGGDDQRPVRVHYASEGLLANHSRTASGALLPAT